MCTLQADPAGRFWMRLSILGGRLLLLDAGFRL